MKQGKPITSSELHVMKVIWREETCTAATIVEHIAKESAWHFRTTKTLLRNLVNKQLVGFSVDENDSRIYHYYPLIRQEEYLRQERKQFLSLYYDGKMNSLLAGFLKDSRITDAEAQELKDLLNDSIRDEAGGKD